jgi:hypothetical protein
MALRLEAMVMNLRGCPEVAGVAAFSPPAQIASARLYVGDAESFRS